MQHWLLSQHKSAAVRQRWRRPRSVQTKGVELVAQIHALAVSPLMYQHINQMKRERTPDEFLALLRQVLAYRR